MNFDHPAFLPYQPLIVSLELARALPTLDALNALASKQGIVQSRLLPVRFSPPEGRLSARAYETHILQTGQVSTRTDSWHDVMNALVWLRFPGFKAALNAAHGVALAAETDTQRGRRRDAMTMLDESGVWVVSQDAMLPDLLVERAWKDLFWHHRQAVKARMLFVVVGHALLEKALAPYPAMTGKCLVVKSDQLEPDSAAPHAVRELDTIMSPRQLAPLPVQGVPDWDADNAKAAYYSNTAIFRPGTSTVKALRKPA